MGAEMHDLATQLVLKWARQGDEVSIREVDMTKD